MHFLIIFLNDPTFLPIASFGNLKNTRKSFMFFTRACRLLQGGNCGNSGRQSNKVPISPNPRATSAGKFLKGIVSPQSVSTSHHSFHIFFAPPKHLQKKKLTKKQQKSFSASASGRYIDIGLGFSHFSGGKSKGCFI